jgi:hypothetical protein
MSIYQQSKETQPALFQFNESFVVEQSSRNIDFSTCNQGIVITARWRGSHRIEILENKNCRTVADITLPLLPLGTAQIQFPQLSTADADELSIKPLGFIGVDKSFVYKDTEYLRKTLSSFTARDYTLYRYFS